MSSPVTMPLGWDVGIEIPAFQARRPSGFLVEQHIDFKFVNVRHPPSTPAIEQVRYDRQGRIQSRSRRGRLLDEIS